MQVSKNERQESSNNNKCELFLNFKWFYCCSSTVGRPAVAGLPPGSSIEEVPVEFVKSKVDLTPYHLFANSRYL